MRHPLKSYQDPPLGPGRYHRVNGQAAWYASDREQGAWAELFRHNHEMVSPFEMRRRIGAVTVIDLRVLDLNRARIRERLGLDEADLVDDDLKICQEIAEKAGKLFDGLLGPSAALPGAQTLAVFPKGMEKVHLVTERIRQPPPRMADLIGDIRLHHEIKPAVAGLLRGYAGEGAEGIRRLRRVGTVIDRTSGGYSS